MWDIGRDAKRQQQQDYMDQRGAEFIQQKDDALKKLEEQEMYIIQTSTAKCLMAIGVARRIVPSQNSPEYLDMVNKAKVEYRNKTGKGVSYTHPLGISEEANAKYLVDRKLADQVSKAFFGEALGAITAVTAKLLQQRYIYAPAEGASRRWWQNMPSYNFGGKLLTSSVNDDGTVMECRLPDFGQPGQPGDWHWGRSMGSRSWIYAYPLFKVDQGKGKSKVDVLINDHIANNPQITRDYEDADKISEHFLAWNMQDEPRPVGKEGWYADSPTREADAVNARFDAQMRYRVTCQIRAHLQAFTESASFLVAQYLDQLAKNKAKRSTEVAANLARIDREMAIKIQQEIDAAKAAGKEILAPSQKEIEMALKSGGRVVKDEKTGQEKIVFDSGVPVVPLLLLAGVGAGAWYYFKHKPKSPATT
jgi:hypothetical protein